MEEVEKLFLDTIADIRSKLASGDRYQILRASGLLRHLLLDEEPLVHRVNRGIGLKLTFRIIDFTIKPPIKPAVHWTNLNPAKFPNAKTVEVSLDKFLGADVLSFRNHDYSVKEVIKACAHLKGGVHSGKPSSDKEQTLLNLDAVLEIGGLEASVAAVKAIIETALTVLQPLIAAIDN